MRWIVCLLIVLSPTLLAALTSHHGAPVEAPAAPIMKLVPSEAAWHIPEPDATPLPEPRNAEVQLLRTEPDALVPAARMLELQPAGLATR